MAYLQESKCICGKSLRRGEKKKEGKKRKKENKTYLKNNVWESIDEWIKKRGMMEYYSASKKKEILLFPGTTWMNFGGTMLCKISQT